MQRLSSCKGKEWKQTKLNTEPAVGNCSNGDKSWMKYNVQQWNNNLVTVAADISTNLSFNAILHAWQSPYYGF